MIKSWKMKVMERVICMGTRENLHDLGGGGSMKERNYSDDLGLGGRTILKVILNKKYALISSGSEQRQLAQPSEYCNKFPISEKCRTFLTD
jgi:hypothetical protein